MQKQMLFGESILVQQGGKSIHYNALKDEIIIGTILLNSLSSKELRAAILHERGHSKESSSVITWAVVVLAVLAASTVLILLLSRNTLWVWYIIVIFIILLLIIKWVSEFIADSHSLKRGSSPGALLAAIGKAKDLQRPEERVLACITHPPLRLRYWRMKRVAEEGE